MIPKNKGSATKLPVSGPFVAGFFLFFVTIFIFGGLCGSQGCAAESKPDSVLERLEQEADTVRSLQSRFTQKKTLELFDDTVVSKGNFYFRRPDSLRWEYTEPIETGFILTGDEGVRLRAGEEPQVFNIRSDPIMAVVVEQITAWTVFDAERLLQDFDFTVVRTQPIELLLKPKGAAGRFLDRLEIVFSEDDRTVRMVRVFEPGGDSTVIEFHETLVNPDLSETIFDP